MFKIGSLIVVLAVIGCSKKEEDVYSRGQMFKMGKESEEKFDLVLGGDLREHLKNDPCHNYGEGCVATIMVTVRGLNIIFVEFNNSKNALLEAKRINQYYVKNWVIDDVKGEPGLEKFVEKAFGAKQALEVKGSTFEK